MTAEAGAPEGAREAYDDRPFRAEGLPPELRAPLAPFAGAEPPAPDWFRWAIAQEPERGFVTSRGARIETLAWGERGKPGLLLAHGNSAHADWWSFVAPYLAQDYRVAALSLAGMGGSDWRARYSYEDFADDAEAVARATGLYDGGRKPIYIGHSFGGAQVFRAAATRPERMHAVVLVDAGFGRPPPAVLAAGSVRNIPTGDRASRVYPTLAEALARFRLMPPQPAERLYIVDFIARRSLKRAPMPDGSGEGWAWKFDPSMWDKLDRTGMDIGPGTTLPTPAVPLAHLYGDKSLIVARRAAGQLAALPPETLEIVIPESHHHVMIDQPLALVAGLRSLLAAWPG